jgi:hypothetical protein
MRRNSAPESEWEESVVVGGEEQLEMHSRGSKAQLEKGRWRPTIVLWMVALAGS